MTHEFRTPLNSIISLSRMLADRLDGDLTPEQEKQVGFIQNAAKDLSQLVNDLLDLSKVEAGKVSIRPETFDLKGLFASLRGTLRPLLAQNSSVNLVFEEPENIPPLFTDESKVSQILRNFISNALKYTEHGEVRVSASMEDSGHVLISVVDTGIGIAPEDQARIFEEFEQVEGPHQRKAKGTGLGLPLAKSLAELLGGSVQLRSARGLGSTFSVRLPTHYACAAAVKDSRLPGASDHKRVLIVDDDAASRYVLRNLLGEQHFQIAEAAGGTEGLAQAISLKPSVIFLDLGLPDLDGRAVLRQLKQNAATAEIPVIINTSRSLEPSDRAELAVLAVGVLSKNDNDPNHARENVRELLAASGV
jgi:CheY-like chemotaxis protein/two-component sensor histidine kinase